MSTEFLGYTVEYYNYNSNNCRHIVKYPMYRSEPDANKHIGKYVRNYMRSWNGFELALVRECWVIDGVRYWKHAGRFCWNRDNTRIVFSNLDGILNIDLNGICKGFVR